MIAVGELLLLGGVISIDEEREREHEGRPDADGSSQHGGRHHGDSRNLPRWAPVAPVTLRAFSSFLDRFYK